jgi:hypothetical protein
MMDQYDILEVRSRLYSYLETGAIEIGDGDKSGTYHPKRNGEVSTRTPEWVRVHDRDTAISYGKQTAVLHEYHSHVTR